MNDPKIKRYELLTLEELKIKFHLTNDLKKRSVLKKIYKEKKNKLREEELIKQMLNVDKTDGGAKSFIRLPYESIDKRYMEDIMKDTNNNNLMERMEHEIDMRNECNNNRKKKTKFYPPYKDV